MAIIKTGIQEKSAESITVRQLYYFDVSRMICNVFSKIQIKMLLHWMGSLLCAIFCFSGHRCHHEWLINCYSGIVSSDFSFFLSFFFFFCAFKVVPRVEKTEAFRKGWNFANRTYFMSYIMRKHFLLWTEVTAFFAYF